MNNHNLTITWLSIGISETQNDDRSLSEPPSVSLLNFAEGKRARAEFRPGLPSRNHRARVDFPVKAYTLYLG